MDNQHASTLEQPGYKMSNKRFRHPFANYFAGITVLPLELGLAFDDYAAVFFNNN